MKIKPISCRKVNISRLNPLLEYWSSHKIVPDQKLSFCYFINIGIVIKRIYEK